MKFGHPDVVWLAALLLPALAGFLVWAWRRKQKLVAQFVQSRLLAHLTVGVSQARQKLRLVLLFLAVLFALLAWARPQWGFDWQEATSQGLDIIVAIDTSKSMLAEDIAPNRLARAKLAAFDLLQIAKSDRFGLVAFAGTAFLQCPLTLDEQVFRQSVEALDVNIIPQGGTALSEAINTAAQAFEKSENHKVLVLFTDGEDHDNDALNAAEKAAKNGMKIFTIGFGTREGEMLRIRDEKGNQQFLKDAEGNAVKSRLNESLLQEIAAKGNGFYLPLVGTTVMDTLYSRGLAPLPRSESGSKLVKNYKERFHWPLTIAILLLLVETFLPHRRRKRTGTTQDAQATAALKKATVTLIFLLTPLLSTGSPASAKKKYETGQYKEAFAEYQKLLQKKTNDFRLQFNAGDAAYEAKEFDAARKLFETTTISPDLELQQKGYYNLGNTLYQIGESLQDPKEKQKEWEQAIASYKNALRLNEKDGDAQHNVKFVQQKLEELKQQQQQQDQSKQDKGDENKDQQDQKDQQKQDSAQNDQKKDQQQEQQQSKEDQQKQEQAQKDQQQQKEQQEQQEQQAKDQQKQNQDQAQKKEGQSGKPGEEQNAEQGQEAQMADGKMTEEQAQQFLEAMKREEKPLIFMPQPKERKNSGDPLKDW